MTINESIIIIVVVIIAIIIGMTISMTIFCNYHIRTKNPSNWVSEPKYGSGENEKYFEDLAIYDGGYDGENDGENIKLTIVDDVKGCIDTYNKDGLISDILKKTFEPILYVSDIKEQLPYKQKCI